MRDRCSPPPLGGVGGVAILHAHCSTITHWDVAIRQPSLKPLHIQVYSLVRQGHFEPLGDL